MKESKKKLEEEKIVNSRENNLQEFYEHQHKQQELRNKEMTSFLNTRQKESKSNKEQSEQ